MKKILLHYKQIINNFLEYFLTSRATMTNRPFSFFRLAINKPDFWKLNRHKTTLGHQALQLHALPKCAHYVTRSCSLNNTGDCLSVSMHHPRLCLDLNYFKGLCSL